LKFPITDWVCFVIIHLLRSKWSTKWNRFSSRFKNKYLKYSNNPTTVKKMKIKLVIFLNYPIR